ncbi:hypothetical protein WJX72_005714 [[Myrmecia] bisecta]|uniref:Cupin type-1 domain-containing protein n=1 Tax=[Myrmecia] bisecta TaxID=41462 RepID=A0AAW1Q0V9_9CHLO
MSSAATYVSLFVLLGLLAVGHAADPTPLDQLSSSAFVYRPATFTATPNLTVAGVRTKRSTTEWPALTGLGLAQTVFTLQPCAARVPHHHQKASGLLYAFNAAQLEVGLVLETGEQIVNVIKTGASAIFPVGLVHYQRNLDCSPASYVITYNDEDAGTVNLAPALLNLPQDTVMDVLGLDAPGYQGLLQSAHNDTFTIGTASIDCRKRCAATVVPLPAVSGRKMK